MRESPNVLRGPCPSSVARNLACALALLLLVQFQHASASPWGRNAGHVFLSTKSTFVTASGESAAGSQRLKQYGGEAYAEIGLGSGFMAGGKALYGQSDFYDGVDGHVAQGVSEFEGFVQKQILSSPFGVIAIQAIGASPSRILTGLAPGFSKLGPDAEARVLYGRSLREEPFALFAGLEAGYRRRFGAGLDQVRGTATLGAEYGRLLVLIESRSTYSPGRHTLDNAGYDLVTSQATAVYRVTRRMSIEAGATFDITGKDILTGHGFFVGLWSSF